MDLTTARTAAHEALEAVTQQGPADARGALADLSFAQRAVVIAWAGELVRLTRSEQSRWEQDETTASREEREAPAEEAPSTDQITRQVSKAPGQLAAEGVLSPIPGGNGIYEIVKGPGLIGIDG